MRKVRPLVTHLFATLVGVLSSAQFASAQPRVSGQVFADALAALSGYSAPADSSAFRFRRMQVTATAPLDTTFSVLVQLEVDDGEQTSQGKSAAFMKQAWLRWGRVHGLGDLTLGLSPTPTWDLSEAYWGYRSIEKTVMDLAGLGFATDIGVSLRQAAGPTHPVGWFVMLSNDNGQRPENNGTKRLALSVPWRIGDFVVEGLADATPAPGPLDRWTGKVFVGWQHGPSAAGLETYERVNAAAGVNGADVRPAGVSLFGHRAFAKTWQMVGRVDWTDPDVSTHGSGYRQLYFIAALDASPRANVHLMPNALIRTYSAKAGSLPNRDPDVTLRVTLWFDLK